MSLEKRAQLMRIVALILGGYALLWASAPYDAINWPARLILSVSAGDISSINNPLSAEVKWLSAIGSGLLMLMAIFCYGIIAPAIVKNEQNSIHVFSIAVFAWYMMDNIGSLASGYFLNIVFNTVFLIILLWPIYFSRSSTVVQT